MEATSEKLFKMSTRNVVLNLATTPPPNKKSEKTRIASEVGPITRPFIPRRRHRVEELPVLVEGEGRSSARFTGFTRLGSSQAPPFTST